MEQIRKIWNKLGLGGDPFSYARLKEAQVAHTLNHKISPTYSGADGVDENNNKCEYKTTINDNGWTYSGISRKDTWDQQEEYLQTEKIGNYSHFLARYDHDGVDIIEIWQLTPECALNILTPKLKKQFQKQGKTKKGTGSADPRLCAKITKNEAKKYGIKVYSRNGSSTSIFN